MAKWIGEYIPNEIETYVEVFGGAFWVYINGEVDEKPKLKEVIYNDFSYQLPDPVIDMTYETDNLSLIGYILNRDNMRVLQVVKKEL